MSNPPNGIIPIDKPGGITSARVVSIVKRLLPRGTKIGHAGTLDPFATGVLLLLVGKATKACERLMDAPKQYEATIRFGATTATDDPDAPPTPWVPAGGGDIVPPGAASLPPVLEAFVGEILQRPPAYSALKIGGRRAYDLARQGGSVDLQPRPVRVYGIEMLEYAWPALRLRIDCGRGTYIRAIARDLGERLDVGGHLAALRRTRVGPFSAVAAVAVERLTPANVESHLVPVP